jgi:hypothetical protein
VKAREKERQQQGATDSERERKQHMRRIHRKWEREGGERKRERDRHT